MNLKKLFLLLTVFYLYSCAYDPFGNAVSIYDPWFGSMWILGGIITAIVWLVDKLKGKK